MVMIFWIKCSETIVTYCQDPVVEMFHCLFIVLKIALSSVVNSLACSHANSLVAFNEVSGFLANSLNASRRFDPQGGGGGHSGGFFLQLPLVRCKEVYYSFLEICISNGQDFLHTTYLAF